MEKYSVVVTGKVADEAMRLLEPHCRVVCTKPYCAEDEFAALMAEVSADALIVRGVAGKVSKKIMQASGRLRVIAKHGVGTDNIDVAAATELGIPVLNTPEANFEAVAEHVLGMILCLAKDLSQQDARVRAGFWDKLNYRGAELNEKTLGLVGYGRIGRRLRELVAPLHMNVLVYDPYLPPVYRDTGVTWVDNLDKLLAASDIVSLHCPLTEQTRGMMGAGQFGLMKPGAFLVNTARGPIIDEAALIAALREKKIAGVGMDTFSTEPPANIAEIAAAGKALFTPHLGAATEEAFVRMGVGAAEGVLAVLRGGEAPAGSCVNRPR
ncbi:hydroxyacid dehydrogenase [bacterium]|nr:hydroxyacid dehydrogenase [bacterium]